MTLHWLSLVTGLAYIVLGGFVFYKEWFLIPLEKHIAYFFSAILISYGSIRIFRAIKNLKTPKE